MKEYEEGKKYLAKMMGKNPENFTQKNIEVCCLILTFIYFIILSCHCEIDHCNYFQEAIEYLLPSALFVKEARPMFAHPQELFKKQKEAQFDASGRPHHYLFYTTKPNYYQALHVS